MATSASRVEYDDVVTDIFAKDEVSSVERVGVFGAGLVGSLAACVLAKRGFKVDLYEYRADIRNLSAVQGRSINMTIAIRGLKALERIGLKDVVMEHSIAVNGRMVHRLDGTMQPFPYGIDNQSTFSIPRTTINQILLNAAEEYPNININFSHKMLSFDHRNTEAEFELKDGQKVTKRFSAVVGTDGSYSKTRQSFLKSTSFNFAQEYIDSLYLELVMPPNDDGTSKMEVNYLHVWPRGNFMLLGLPNQDKSWTMTLFGPKSIYDSFQTHEGVLRIFEEHFLDAIPLIGRESILKSCLRSRGYPMISIKCSPHVLNNTILLGDAAHAMVPFYGEGMNCGFGDCVVLDDLLNTHGNLKDALEQYSAARVDDVHAMCDLAIYNYSVLTNKCSSPTFKIRKQVDNTLSSWFPKFWIPLYTSVRFETELSYRECLNNKAWQDSVLKNALKVVSLASCIATIMCLFS